MFVLGSLIADVTGNRVVNATDRGIVQQNIGKTCPEGDLPSHDPFRPEGIPDSAFPLDQRLLRLSYLKVVALGKIENGQFNENPTVISVDEIDK